MPPEYFDPRAGKQPRPKYHGEKEREHVYEHGHSYSHEVDPIGDSSQQSNKDPKKYPKISLSNPGQIIHNAGQTANYPVQPSIQKGSRNNTALSEDFDDDEERYDAAHPLPRRSPRKSFVSIAPMSSVAQPISISQPLRSLSRLSAAFVTYATDDYDGCYKFVTKYPDTVRESRDELKDVAVSAYMRDTADDDDYANRCMHRWLILSMCKGFSGPKTAEYIKKVARDNSTYKEFKEGLGRVTKGAKDNARELQQRQQRQSSQATPSIPIPAKPNLTTTQTYSGPDTPRELAYRPGHPTTSSYMKGGTGGYGPSQPSDSRPYSMSQSAPAPTAIDMYDRYRPTGPSPYPHQQSSTVIQPTADERLRSTSTANTLNPAFLPGLGNDRRAPAESTQRQHPSLSPAPLQPAALDPNVNPRLEQNAKGDPTIPRDGVFDIQGDYTVKQDGFEPKYDSFFKVGRVFTLLWPLPAGNDLYGQPNQPNQGSGMSVGSLGNRIYTKEMWMLVVMSKKGYCICCPISTYGGYGLCKEGWHKNGRVKEQEVRAHAIIYSEGEKPVRFKDEPVMGKDPIMVQMASGRPSLQKASRVHFGKWHTVETNVAVKDIGRLGAEAKERALGYFFSQYQQRGPG